MMAEARKVWINSRRKRGDLGKVVEHLTEKGHPVTYTIVKSVVIEGTWGKYGEIIWDELERIIKRREKLLKQQSEKYAA